MSNGLPKVIRTDGQEVQFKRMTDKICPVCASNPNGSRMGVIAERQGTLTLECENCGYNEYVLEQKP